MPQLKVWANTLIKYIQLDFTLLDNDFSRVEGVPRSEAAIRIHIRDLDRRWSKISTLFNKITEYALQENPFEAAEINLDELSHKYHEARNFYLSAITLLEEDLLKPHTEMAIHNPTLISAIAARDKSFDSWFAPMKPTQMPTQNPTQTHSDVSNDEFFDLWFASFARKPTLSSTETFVESTTKLSTNSDEFENSNLPRTPIKAEVHRSITLTQTSPNPHLQFEVLQDSDRNLKTNVQNEYFNESLNQDIQFIGVLNGPCEDEHKTESVKPVNPNLPSVQKVYPKISQKLKKDKYVENISASSHTLSDAKSTNLPKNHLVVNDLFTLK